MQPTPAQPILALRAAEELLDLRLAHLAGNQAPDVLLGGRELAVGASVLEEDHDTDGQPLDRVVSFLQNLREAPLELGHLFGQRVAAGTSPAPGSSTSSSSSWSRSASVR